MSQPSIPSPARPVDFKVTLTDERGYHLAQGQEGLFFSQSRVGALILDFYADQVQEQLQDLKREAGIQLTPEPVPMEEVYERCDRCGELFHPTMIYFTGTKFFCRECSKLAGKSGRRPPVKQTSDQVPPGT